MVLKDLLILKGISRLSIRHDPGGCSHCPPRFQGINQLDRLTRKIIFACVEHDDKWSSLNNPLQEDTTTIVLHLKFDSLIL